jgi:hypothetical protein
MIKTGDWQDPPIADASRISRPAPETRFPIASRALSYVLAWISGLFNRYSYGITRVL